MVREKSSIHLLLVPGSPFLQEHPERSWVGKACLGSYPFVGAGMVLGPVCSVLSEDKRNHFVWTTEIGEDSGHALSLGFCGGGNQLVASGLDFLTNPVHVTGRVSFLCHLSYTKSCPMGCQLGCSRPSGSFLFASCRVHDAHVVFL